MPSEPTFPTFLQGAKTLSLWALWVVSVLAIVLGIRIAQGDAPALNDRTADAVRVLTLGVVGSILTLLMWRT